MVVVEVAEVLSTPWKWEMVEEERNSWTSFVKMRCRFFSAKVVVEALVSCSFAWAVEELLWPCG